MLLGKQLKAEETVICEKEKPLIKKEKVTVKRYDKLNLIYNKLSFYSYSDDKKLYSISFKLNYSYLLNFYDDLEKLIKMKPTNLDKIKGKEKVHHTVSKLYNKKFENYSNEYDELSDAKKDNLDQKFKSIYKPKS